MPAIELHFYQDAASLMADYRAGTLDAASGLSAADTQALAAEGGSRLLRYPRTTYTGVVLNERITHPNFRPIRFRRALLQAIDRNKVIATTLAGFGQRADTPISPASWAFDATAAPAVKYDPKAAAKALKAEGWTRPKGVWIAPRAKRPFELQVLAPDEASSPIVHTTAVAVVEYWQRLGFRVKLTSLPARAFATRLGQARFDLAVVDVDVGLDPDLYPFFASTQTTTGGANVSGVQQPALDLKLKAARRFSTIAKRRAAFRDLEAYLGASLVSLPLYFRDNPFVVRDRVFGPSPVAIADGSGRYWDVLTWRLANDR